MKENRVLVAVPSYQCEKQIGRVLEGFDPRLLARVEKILVIDNCSKDRTAECALASIRRCGLSAKAEVVVNAQNYGLGGSQKAAFLYAEKQGMDYVAILHGDHQAETQDLHRLLDSAEQDPSQAAILGARFMWNSKRVGYSRLRTLGNLGLNWLYTLLSGHLTKDLGSGLNLFKVQTLKDRRYLQYADAFTFNMDLLLDFFRQRSPVKFVPIIWREEDQISNAKTFRVGWTALLTLLRWRFGCAPALSTQAEHYIFRTFET